MAWAVISIPDGLPVIDVTGTAPLCGLPVTESNNGYGMRVTRVSAPQQGLAVRFVLTTLQERAVEDDGDQPLAEQGA
jgi:hypothetical protein